MAAIEAFYAAWQAQQTPPPVVYASKPIAWDAWRKDRERRKTDDLLLILEEV